MKAIKVIIFVLILVTIGIGIYFFSVNKNKLTNVGDSSVANNIPTSEIPLANMANPASVNCVNKGGKLSIVDKPEGQVGMCTLSDGTVCEEWAYFRGECATPSPILTPGTEKAIQAFLANKYKKPISEVKVIIQKEAPGFAAGRVSFGQDGPGEGGMWLAVAGNQWDVVWDGNGSVDCNKMRQQYGFPDTILKPNFCD